MPLGLRGALSISKTTALRGSNGSTSNCTVPRSFSYGPVSPNGIPSRTTSRVVTSMRVTRASAQEPRKLNATSNEQNRISLQFFISNPSAYFFTAVDTPANAPMATRVANRSAQGDAAARSVCGFLGSHPLERFARETAQLVLPPEL